MAKLAASCLAMLLSACASIDQWPYFVGPRSVLTGRVVASRQVVYFFGDVAAEAHVYVVEPVNHPRNRVMAFVGPEDCEAARNDGRTYRMRLSRGTIHYGLTANPEDRRWTPSLVILSCLPVAEE